MRRLLIIFLHSFTVFADTCFLSMKILNTLPASPIFFSIWQRYSSVKKKTNKQANKSKTGTMSCLLINGKCYFFCKIKFLSIFSCQCSRPVAVIPQSYSCADECIYYLKNSLGISVLFCFSLLKILVFTNFIEPKSVLKLT